MSQENLQLAYRSFDAFNRRDIDAYLALMDDDVEGVPRAVAMEGGDHYRGHDGARRWWRDLFDVFPDFSIDVSEVRELGDLTVGLMRQRGRGAGSNTPTEDSTWIVAQWRNGKCVWWRTFGTRDEAYEAVGL